MTLSMTQCGPGMAWQLPGAVQLCSALHGSPLTVSMAMLTPAMHCAMHRGVACDLHLSPSSEHVAYIADGPFSFLQSRPQAKGAMSLTTAGGLPFSWTPQLRVVTHWGQPEVFKFSFEPLARSRLAAVHPAVHSNWPHATDTEPECKTRL